MTERNKIVDILNYNSDQKRTRGGKEKMKVIIHRDKKQKRL